MDELSKKFKSQVERNFSFLMHEYNCKITKEEFSDYGDRIVYESSLCRVNIVMEKLQVFVGLSPTNKSNEEIDLGHIILYKDPKSNFEYAFDPEGYVETEPIRLAMLLNKYCVDILKGDFSCWPEIIAFREKMAKELYGPKSNA